MTRTAGLFRGAELPRLVLLAVIMIGSLVAATVTSADGGSLELMLASPIRAITPGQSGVLYVAGDQVLGGGVIG